VLLASYAFAIQIFCDFAGYSSIARGVGRVMGFDIMLNFNVPYLSTCPREFWQRWHISLSTWLRDYLYIPLGGNRKGRLITYRNLAITMILGGLWHGATWMFVLWGAYHGILLIVYRLCEPLLARIPRPRNTIIAKTFFLVKIIIFFHLICIGWLIFRTQSINQLFEMLGGLFCNFTLGDFSRIMIERLIVWSGLLFVIQLFQYTKKDLLFVFRLKPAYQIFLYLMVFYSLLMLGATSSEEFVYFQF
jgi:D-alanyl-lipoteichoic acid acyltransferase DltB (MBOAT superfamily)